MWSQRQLRQCVVSMFPAEWLSNSFFPSLEDLVNQSPFVNFAKWLDERSIAGPVGSTAGQGTSAMLEAAAGRQAGALSAKHALPPLLGHSRDEEEHFRAAVDFAKRGKLPFDEDVAAPHDLKFAAESTAAELRDLREFRLRSMHALQELSRRCKPLTAELLKWQSPTVRAVAGHIHAGLIAVLVVLTRWPDRKLALRFVTGFGITGVMEDTGAFEPSEYEAPMPVHTLLGESKVLLAELDRQRASEEGQFLWDSCEEECKKGWAAPLRCKSDIDAEFGAGQWAPIPAFCHVQPSGKRRRIDDGRRGRQNEATAFCERQRMCTPFQPVIDARVVRQACADAGADVARERLVSGGEDLPSAYRSVPVHPDHLRLNVVAVRDPVTGEWKFQVAWALRFGFSASVMQFARWGGFLQAVQRRVLSLLLAMYVDDANITDFESAGGAGQEAAQCLCAELGTPVAPSKTRGMSPSGDFLGVVHTFGPSLDSNAISFRARDTLVEKAKTFIEAKRSEGRLTPGDASKLRGLLNFIARAAWHGVGKAGMGALRQRQYTDQPPWTLSNCLVRALDFFYIILQDMPCRVAEIAPRSEPLILIASDARVDNDAWPTGGYVLLDCSDGYRQAGFCVFDGALLGMWGYCEERLRQGGQPIALCEGAMPPIIYQRHAKRLANRRVLYFIDNTSSLHSYVKGCAVPAALDRSIAFTNFLASRRSITTWWEFTPSGTNWSDGISRQLGSDAFVRRHRFPAKRIGVDSRIWTGSLESAWRFASG